jgi:hypothetical protein
MPSPKKHLQHGSNHCTCFPSAEIGDGDAIAGVEEAAAEAAVVSTAPDKF